MRQGRTGKKLDVQDGESAGKQWWEICVTLPSRLSGLALRTRTIIVDARHG